MLVHVAEGSYQQGMTYLQAGRIQEAMDFFAAAVSPPPFATARSRFFDG